MKRRHIAYLLLAVAVVATAVFYVRLFSYVPVGDVDYILSALAALTFVWGVALLLPSRIQRWSVPIATALTVVVSVILAALVRATPG